MISASELRQEKGKLNSKINQFCNYLDSADLGQLPKRSSLFRRESLVDFLLKQFIKAQHHDQSVIGFSNDLLLRHVVSPSGSINALKDLNRLRSHSAPFLLNKKVSETLVSRISKELCPLGYHVSTWTYPVSDGVFAINGVEITWHD